jgi:endonuclease/exonuclease/phosphatase family metal-dependent hydrolase
MEREIAGRRSTVFVLLSTLLLAGQVAAQDFRPDDKQTITVMTRNVYHGVNDEIFAVPGATSDADLLARVTAVYQGYFARNFPERAAALAAEIEAARPDLIGLQEAVLVRIGGVPATTVALDYVQILLDALASRGLRYHLVVQAIGLDVQLPSSLGFYVRHTDREVILARSDSPIELSNAQTGNFTTNCVLPAGLLTPPVTIQRGWASVDGTLRNNQFRFLTTHLDGDCLKATAAVQHAQAAEILAGPAATTLPVIYVGDLNAPADGTGFPGDRPTTTYADTLASGFVDAWVEAASGEGLTCCQDSHLLNPLSTASERIDYVLFKGDFKVRAAAVVGATPADRTPSGLWPSDHAGVVADLKLPNEPRN